jgi:hypothetical protein
LVLAAQAAAPAAAQAARTLDVEAALDLTEGLVRPGAYVPVRFTITNRTGFTFDAVRVEPAGPVRTVAPFALAPAATGETTVPVFYAGGDLVLRVECLAGGRVRAAGRVDRLKATPLAEDAALVGLEAGLPKPEGPGLEALGQALDGRTPRFLPLDADGIGLLARCGILDAAVTERVPVPPGDLVAVGRSPSGRAEVRPSPFPRGVRMAVDPAAHRVFAVEAWPAEDRARLWLGLGVFGLAVLGAGLVVPRRRAILALGTLAALGAAATALLWQCGGVRGARASVARVFYDADGADHAAVEWYAHLAWRGGGAMEFPLPAPPGRSPATPWPSPAEGHAWPVPVVRASNELLRPLGTLVLEGRARFRADAPGVLLHGLGVAGPPPAASPLAEVRVEGEAAEVLAPAPQPPVPLGACAVKWKDSADPDLAYAGRGLAWWASARRQGEGPVRLAWVPDAPTAGGAVAPPLPALIVRSGCAEANPGSARAKPGCAEANPGPNSERAAGP